MSESKNLIKQNITETLEKNYMPYAMSVIVSRAIPDIDGFKPAHRKLLYTMFEMGLLKGKRVKCADIVGQTMRLNPHGDSAIYETLVRLTRGNDALLHPFIDSKGSFGKQTSRDMAYAASRYTEAKLDLFCEEIFKDINKNAVEFMENYNGTMEEPILFPTTFPNVLVTPNLGIAVGMASNICSFNLKEVCEATIMFMKNPEADIKKFLLGPDFSTGGQLIYNEKETESIYETGRGSFKVRGKYRFDKKNSCIEIFEIPYTTTIEAIIDKIILLVKSNKIREINDVRDETDLNGLKIAIDIKKNSDPDLLMNKLFSMTPLQDNFSCNFNILIEGRPLTLGVKEILGHWIKFRTKCIKNITAFDIKKKTDKYHLLEGLSKIILDIDKAIKIIRETEDDKSVVPNLMNYFKIDEVQSEFVAEIKLRNLNKEYLLNKVKEMENLEEDIKELNELLIDEKKIKKLIETQLKDVSKKYGGVRRTEITHEEKIEKMDHFDFIEDYGVKLFLTKHNYFKKISLVSLRSASDQNIKEDDGLLMELDSTNKSELLFFSNKQNVYKQKCYDIPDCKASSLGEYLANFLGLDEGEEIIFVASTITYDGYMLFVFENGKIAKTPMSSYSTKVNRKKLINSYSDKSKCVFVDYILEDSDYVLIRDTDKALLINSELILEKAIKNATGNQVYNLKKNSKVSKVIKKEFFICEKVEYYRSTKVPAAGHFLTEEDKKNNSIV